MSDHSTAHVEVPDLKKGAFQANLLSGFLVFLIALPLCLGIAVSSGYPPIAGIWTAIFGGIITTFISNSELTIKGPAAGMIVIAVGSVNGFTDMVVNEKAGHEVKAGSDEYKAIAKDPDTIMKAQSRSYAVGVVAGCIQILFGLIRAGVLADFFPISAVHGLLASIGLIIIFKTVYWQIGLDPPKGTALDPLLQLPDSIKDTVPRIAEIGLPCLVLLFVIASIRNKYVKMVPPQVYVLVFAIPMGLILNIESFKAADQKSAKYLINIQNVIDNPVFPKPDFSGILTEVGITYIILFAMVGSLESLLSAKAIDLVDPWKRKTNLNRDILAVGVANTAVALIGGLPMISEIVRSKANIDNRGRTRFADLYHSLFLLVAIMFLAKVIHLIPLSALGAMLVFTGYRLAHPREFIKTFKIGPEQFLIFMTTIIGVLLTDLLKGIAMGFAMKLLILMVQGIWPGAWFQCNNKILPREDGSTLVHVSGAMVFLSWLRLKPRLLKIESKHVVLDVSEATYIDHTVMEKLHEMEMDFHNSGRKLELTGLDKLKPIGWHPFSARKRRA
jgi:MFS superfamily sulfate permease-like transporter